ncbi:MAG: DUF885 domain-containing protein [Hyphomonadaceae bacterium]
MNRFLIGLLSAAALIACTPQQAAEDAQIEANLTQKSETERLNVWFEEKFEQQLLFSPIQQTLLGRKTAYGQIDDYSSESRDRQLEWQLASAAELQDKFNYDVLTADAKISYDLWLFMAERAERNAKFRSQIYALHQHNGLQSFFPTFLINTHKVDTAEDMEAYILRIDGVARALGQLLNRAKENADAGTRPPRFAYEGVITQSTNIISGAPFDEDETAAPSALYADMLGKISALEDSGEIDAVRAEALGHASAKALTELLQAAYTDIIEWFESDIDNTDAQAQGASALPNGEAFYDHRLWVNTTTDLTANEIHEIGLSEVARIRDEMEAVKHELGFNGTLAEFFTYIRDDDQFYFSEDDAGAQDYVDTAAAHIEKLKERLPDFFGILPKADLEVRRVEPFRERPGAAQHYRAGTPDGSRPGIYYAHLSDMRAMPIPTLEVIAYHEGLPGHHMQVSIAQELEGVPAFRTQARFTAYSEGWGLYSESLAKEMGGYQNLVSDFGRLTTEMWRAIRLVVDTGMHAKGWSEEQAQQYFYDNSPVPETAVKSEVRRYLVNPGQATAYKIGMLKILELREKAETALGGQYSNAGFHDVVLGGGAVPLHILEQRVDQWIERTKP